MGSKNDWRPSFATSRQKATRYTRWVFAGPSRKLRSDDNSYDNRDDNYAANNSIFSPKCLVTCLVTVPARCWQCGGQGFESP
jgi:hypothetical protein